MLHSLSLLYVYAKAFTGHFLGKTDICLLHHSHKSSPYVLARFMLLGMPLYSNMVESLSFSM